MLVALPLTWKAHGRVVQDVVRLTGAHTLVPVAVAVWHEEKTFQRVATRGAQLEVCRQRTCPWNRRIQSLLGTAEWSLT